MIANNLDDAMKVAYYSKPFYRVISRNGEFIDITGAMMKLPISKNSSDGEDINIL